MAFQSPALRDATFQAPPRLTIREVWLHWHLRKMREAELSLHRTHDHVETVSLLRTIDDHRAAIRQLDREAESADRNGAA